MIVTRGSSSVGRAQPCPKGWTNGQPWQGRCKSRQKHQAHIDIISGSSSVGRAQPCQGWGRGFEFRLPLSRPRLRLEWWNGRHEGLKIPWPTTAVRVQVPLRVHVSPICNRGTFYGLRIFSYGSGEAISPLKNPIELRPGGIFWPKCNGANQKAQKRSVFFAPRFLYPFHTSKGGIFTPFDRLLYFLEGRRVDQIEHDDLIAACLHCGTAAAEGGNRIAQRLTLKGIM